MALFEPILEALNRASARFVIVGGVAVVLQGHVRLTADLDLVVDLAPNEARKTIDALLALGLRPRVPVDARDFSNADVRASWIADKGMTVFSLGDPDDPVRQVDVFAENPIDFEELWSRSDVVELGAQTVRVASIPDLIALKRLAGRTQDLADIEVLEALLAQRRSSDD